MQEALTRAQGLSHPPSLAFVLLFAAYLHQHRREGQRTQERAEAVMSLCTEQGFAFWLVQGSILRAWTLAQQGQGAEGTAQIRQGLAAYQATGGQAVLPYLLALLAEAYEKAGQGEEGCACWPRR